MVIKLIPLSMIRRLFKNYSQIAGFSLLFLLFGVSNGFSQTINAPTVTGPICAGAVFNLPYTVSAPFGGGNIFTANLSTSAGAFPGTSVGTVAATTNGSIQITIPVGTAASVNYTIRISGSNPITTSPSSNTFTITAPPSISAPTFAPTVFCQGDAFNITVTVPSCAFNTLPSTNVFTAELSNNVGSFASGTTNIGSITATGNTTIASTIPPGTAAGTLYRIRIKSSNPSGIVSTNNGTDLTVNATAGTAGTAGSGQWYVSCYNGNNFTTYYGFYTENVLNFNTQTRWNLNGSPSSANSTGGSAYVGCPIPVDNHSYSYKRTNFACGYYQIDIPSHDDDVYLFVDGAQQFVHNGCCDSHTNVWTGFLGAASIVEFREREGGGQSYLSVNFSTAPNPLTTSTPPFVCSGTTTTLSVSSALVLSYSWTSTGAATSPLTGSTVTSAPTGAAGSTTTYTVTGTDATTSCGVSKNIVATIATAPATAVTPTSATVCTTNPSITLTATGANTYSWSPTGSLSIPPGPGSIVTATPGVGNTVTYTVTGSIGGCAASTTATTTISHPNIPATTVFPSLKWGAYVFGNSNFTSYLGYYDENSLSFNTTTRWAAGSGPGIANSSTGLAYQGCPIGNAGYSISYKRTGFPCGAVNSSYYQIDIPSHDDDINLLINGVSVYSFTGAGGSHINVWTGFLGPSTTVEFRLANTAGTTGNLQVTFTPSSARPLVVSTPITVCTNTIAHLTATSSLAGATYAWTPSAGLTTPSSANTDTGSMTVNTTFTCTLTDAAGTGCTANASVPVTVVSAGTALSMVITPAGPVNLTCPNQSVSLSVSGATNYFPWTSDTAPAVAGLNTTTGTNVIATPTATTIYTVTGNNNCQSGSASVTINVPFPATTVFPANTWNAYGFNTQAFTPYQGYYTENGTGTTGYDFDTRTRWPGGGAPSSANATNGTAWSGCAMNATNISMSLKRTNFVCGTYTVDVLYHDDDFVLLVNGVQVAAHTPGCCDVHNSVWTGTLSPSSTVEWKLMQGGGGSGLQVRFTRAAAVASQTIWTGDTSTDFLTTSNWCTSLPSATIDAVISASGPLNMPIINGAATVRSITISPAIAAATYTSAVPAASLTVAGSNSLSVFGDFINGGTFTANTGRVTFSGSTATTISSVSPLTFYDLTFNKSNTTNNTAALTVTNSATFTNGIVTQNGTFDFGTTATTSGASAASFISGGPVKKTGTAAFVFPIGANTLYAPLSISASAGTDVFSAQYFYTSPNALYPVTSKDPSLDHVSIVEYWNLQRVSGSTDVSVNLKWGANSGVTSPLSDLRVTGWNGTTWKDQGGAVQGGSTSSSGSITTSSAVSVYGPFTLASITTSNPLPIQLKDFLARYEDGGVILNWNTVTEINNDFFTVQRTADAESFDDVANITGAGNSTSPRSYSTVDEQPIIGKSYYRLKQTDFDKKVTYSSLVAVTTPESAARKAFPNPTTGSEVNVSFAKGDVGKSALIKLNGLDGKELFQVVVEKINTPSVKIETPQRLASGLYIISITVGSEIVKQKLIVR